MGSPGSALSDGRPHSCVVVRPTTTLAQKRGQFLHPSVGIFVG